MSAPVETLEDLAVANGGSYYTILGVDGIEEYVAGYEKALAEAGIGKPAFWFQTTGDAVNDYAQPGRPQDAFQPDLVILMFPLDGLDVGKLALFRLAWEDRWFDDMVTNMRFRSAWQV